MEAAAEEPPHHTPDQEIGHGNDLNDTTQDDEFDFEIGGGDDLGGLGEADTARDDLTNPPDNVEAQNGDSYTLNPQEGVPPASNVESDHDAGLEFGHEAVDLAISDFDAYAGQDEYAQDAHDGGLGEPEAVDQDENQDGRTKEEDGSHEGVDYEETAGEFEGLDPVELDLETTHDLLNAATSVDGIQKGVGSQEPAHDTDPIEDRAEARIDTVQDAQYLAETADDGERAETLIDGDHPQDASVAGEAEGSNVNSDADTSLAVDYHTTEVADTSLNESNWDTEDLEGDKDLNSNVFPNVTVSYQKQEYFLFGGAADEDPNTYFLSDVDLLQQPLSEFLSNIRDVISSEVESDQEIFLQVDGLGLEFGESTTQDFLDQTTFAQIIEVNKKLVQHDGGSRSPELFVYLSTRSNPLHRFADLVEGADEGRGLSHFEKYYEDASGNASATNEAGPEGLSDDLISDDLSLDDAEDDEGEAAMDEAAEHYEVEQRRNPFQVVEDPEQSTVDASGSGSAEEDTAEYDADALDPEEAHIFDAVVNAGSALETTDGHEISVADIIEDDASAAGHLDAQVLEVMHEVERQNGDGLSAGSENREMTHEAETLVDLSQEGQEGVDANTAEDDDYLDLGNEGDLLEPANYTDTSNGAAIHNDTSRQVSDNSSATATLDGEDSAHGEDAAMAQGSAYPTNGPTQTDLGTFSNDVDEIDWNHDEDDEIGVAHPNPTNLSPSSLSAKRSRQADEVVDGPGDENAAKRRRT
ncbi:hypothetical protein M406DRAFT_325539 [Cryphonectria parasitica EP155]|uniref:Uncharacterized protein n=1 Tax=Cryphonectria parasitica (strain ATCC 38755 / EP155) TaxID=660469 RepID=A0A9P4YBY6_CRYP1|nr:uncharacterized protein M406DRAFT_325539 [Cryphonectria parasitica EP155]KAF3770067.1 hypothetical protein M406DRAFT_325539 [Cryphonectria parasitica EP155]